MSPQSNPHEAEPGKGAAGNQWAVQTAQTTDVNPPDAKIPTGGDPEANQADIQAAVESEAGTDLHTTDGYVIDEADKIDNFAIEPEMYVEEK
jgi:hypothetical protein